MTILNYSGRKGSSGSGHRPFRGRGGYSRRGRGNGRGNGRGRRGYHNNRSHSQPYPQSHQQPQSHSHSYSYSYVRKGDPNEPKEQGEDQQQGQAPIQPGPPTESNVRVAVSSSHQSNLTNHRQWVRPRDDSSATQAVSTETNLQQASLHASRSNSYKPPATAAEAQQDASNNNSNNSATAEKPAASLVSATCARQDANDQRNFAKIEKKHLPSLQRVGHNKLVLNKAHQKDQAKRTDGHSSGHNNHLHKVHDHQIAASAPGKAKHRCKFSSHQHAYESRKRPRPAHAQPFRHQGAKRIAIIAQESSHAKQDATKPSAQGNQNTTSEDHTDNDNNSNSSDDNGKQTSPSTSTEDSNKAVTKLTKFAYKATHHVTQSARHQVWTSKSNNEPRSNIQTDRPRSMGLSRVRPNDSKTPICTLFLKGMECTNPHCRKRHDIPKEHAMPVCSFFQSRGQCLKGPDCLFRHVKISQDAPVCPTFASLGYCQNMECPMKHIRSVPGKQHTKVRTSAPVTKYNRGRPVSLTFRKGGKRGSNSAFHASGNKGGANRTYRRPSTK